MFSQEYRRRCVAMATVESWELSSKMPTVLLKMNFFCDKGVEKIVIIGYPEVVCNFFGGECPAEITEPYFWLGCLFTFGATRIVDVCDENRPARGLHVVHVNVHIGRRAERCLDDGKSKCGKTVLSSCTFRARNVILLASFLVWFAHAFFFKSECTH